MRTRALLIQAIVLFGCGPSNLAVIELQECKSNRCSHDYVCNNRETMRVKYLCGRDRECIARQYEMEKAGTLRLKRAWMDGTQHLELSPIEWLEKLAALVPVLSARSDVSRA